jgi:rsbT co-antagonist protein RsbR
LILDLTGVPGLEADSADALARIARTAQLLGATVTIAGLRPEAAAAMSGIHFDMSRISAVRNVQEALAACFEQARREAGARGGLARLRGGKEHPIGD